jgi:flagellar biogenesis protein FliO
MSPLASYVAETLITLLAVIALAVLVLYGARRVGIGRPSGPVQLVGRLPLDGRRAVYLVRVTNTVYVLGASEAGLTKLGEITADEASQLRVEDPSGPAFSEILSRALGRKQHGNAARRDPQQPD